jgi:hypothetical protein
MMSDTLDCARSEELLSERLAGTLDFRASAALEAHLAACPRCRALADAVADVVDALQSFPTVEPAPDLAARAATAALAGRRRPGRAWSGLRLPDTGLPAGLQVLAAAAAVLVTGIALLATTHSSQLREETVSASAYLSERKDRVFEDFRLLRVVVTTAFEGRLDRMNDRVDDYRRLLEKRRAAEREQKSTSGPESEIGWVRSAELARVPPGWRNSNNAGRGVVTASERAVGRARRRTRRES